MACTGDLLIQNFTLIFLCVVLIFYFIFLGFLTCNCIPVDFRSLIAVSEWLSIVHWVCPLETKNIFIPVLQLWNEGNESFNIGGICKFGYTSRSWFIFFPTCGFFFRCIWLYIQLHFKSIGFSCSCNAQDFCKSDPKISTEAS